MAKLILRSVFHFCKQIIQKPNSAQSSLVKLSKWISMKSVCSRKEAEEIIKLGLVRIDGKRVYDNLMVPEQANMKAFTMHGVQVEKPVTRLWMLNKPRGYICSHSDPMKRPSIYQLLPPVFKSYGHISSVGRLDFNSEGLLLLTNDVQLKNLLQNPKSNMTRVYRVKVHGRVTPEKLQRMTKPLTINGEEYGPLQATVDRSLTTNVWLNIALKTGRNNQIRRIIQKCDLQVNKLIRLEYGKYRLNKLELGAIKELPVSEGVERKLKIQKAKTLSKDRSCLIEIDIRDKAIQIASQEYKNRIQNEKPAPKLEKPNKIQGKTAKKNRLQQESDSQSVEQ